VTASCCQGDSVARCLLKCQSPMMQSSALWLAPADHWASPMFSCLAYLCPLSAAGKYL
jgi:hypothetical protein